MLNISLPNLKGVNSEETISFYNNKEEIDVQKLNLAGCLANWDGMGLIVKSFQVNDESH